MLVANLNATELFAVPITLTTKGAVIVQAQSATEAFVYAYENTDSIQPNTCDFYKGVADVSCKVAGGIESVIEATLKDAVSTRLVCESFKCEDLSQYTDSMLFESSESLKDDIASASFRTKDGMKLWAYLHVAGDIFVTYKGKVYRHVSDYPTELRDLIGSEDWLTRLTTTDDLTVESNNWFEYGVSACKDGRTIVTDSKVCERDLTKTEPEQILSDLHAFCRQVLKEAVNA